MKARERAVFFFAPPFSLHIFLLPPQHHGLPHHRLRSRARSSHRREQAAPGGAGRGGGEWEEGRGATVFLRPGISAAPAPPRPLAGVPLPRRPVCTHHACVACHGCTKNGTHPSVRPPTTAPHSPLPSFPSVGRVPRRVRPRPRPPPPPRPPPRPGRSAGGRAGGAVPAVGAAGGAPPGKLSRRRGRPGGPAAAEAGGGAGAEWADVW